MGTVSFPDPFLLYTFCACAVKGGGEGRKGSGDKAYPSPDPGRNAAVDDKYALVTTAAWLSCHLAARADRGLVWCPDPSHTIKRTRKACASGERSVW